MGRVLGSTLVALIVLALGFGAFRTWIMGRVGQDLARPGSSTLVKFRQTLFFDVAGEKREFSAVRGVELALEHSLPHGVGITTR